MASIPLLALALLLRSCRLLVEEASHQACVRHITNYGRREVSHGLPALRARPRMLFRHIDPMEVSSQDVLSVTNFFSSVYYKMTLVYGTS